MFQTFIQDFSSENDGNSFIFVKYLPDENKTNELHNFVTF